MKKLNLILSLFVAVLILHSSAFAQVFTDDGLGAGLVDQGPMFMAGSNDYDRVEVRAGGSLTTANGDIGVLIVENAGLVAATSDLNIIDSIWVKNGGTLNMGNRTLDLRRDDPHFLTFDSGAVLTNLGVLHIRDKALVVNNADDAFFTTLDFDAKNHYGNAQFHGTKPIGFNTVEYSNRDGIELRVYGHMIINNTVDYGNKSNSRLTVYPSGMLTLGSNISFINQNNPRTIINPGGKIVQRLNGSLDVAIPNVRFNNANASLWLKAGSGLVLDNAVTNPSVTFSVVDSTLADVDNHIRRWFYGMSYEGVTTPDFDLMMQYTSEDIVGDSAMARPARLAPNATDWSFYGTALADDTIRYSGDVLGLIGARQVEFSAELAPTQTLRESNLSTTDIVVNLMGTAFADLTLDAANFTVNNAPSGVAVASANASSTESATLTLSAPAADFLMNHDSIAITIAAAELDTTADLMTKYVAVWNIDTPSVAPATAQSINVNDMGIELTATENIMADSQQWKFATTSGGPYTDIAGADSLMYTPMFANAGTYYVVMTSTYDTWEYHTPEVMVTVNDPQGLKLTQATNLFKVYPVPAKGTINVEVSTNGTLEVFAVDGKLISQSTLSQPGLHQLQVPQSGLYVVRLLSDNQVQTVMVPINK